ncbi:cation diffusion facilitator family transporter [Kineococcus gynurae]|uniref:Cation diffusion facilitator family transporter n=1 Tax=Kineococcus gynurae TaxID=452979 RepID=A0ABV5LX34_9ACTN
MGAGHGHGHGHAGTDRRRLLVALSLTGTVLVAQTVGALWSGSLALLADAGHMLTDAAGLLIAFLAASLAARPADLRRTWGFRRAEVLAAALQAGILLCVGVFILVEGVKRLVTPSEVASGAMLVFGVVGLAANVVALLVLSGGRKNSFNMRAAFLEVVNDALGSVAVIVAAVVIATTGWTRADAVVSLLIGALILPRTVKLLRETVDVLLESAPRGLDLADVRRHLEEVPHVVAVHDLHASTIATGLPVLSAHVVVADGCFTDGHVPEILDQLQECVAEHFAVTVEHSTFQLEPEQHAEHEIATH